MEHLIKNTRRFGLCWPAMLLAALMLPNLAQSDDTAVCMAEMLNTASDSTTIGELRAQCSQVTSEEALPETAEPLLVVEERLKQDRENVLQPFTLMAHKPNYFLVGAYNAEGYQAGLFHEQYRDPSLEFDKAAAQFQISLKTPLGVNVFDTFDVYGAYTNRSFWQVYNADISSPFRETNHEPEAWVQFAPGWELFGVRNSVISLGVVHQSNGRGGVLSRSWNRVYANFVFQRGQFALGFKPWLRIAESAEVDDNPDITDYLGHYELRAGYKWKSHVFSFMTRNNLESGFERGAFELGWSFPLWNYPYVKGYLQYFRGYGESLIDYDQRVNRIGIGISLTDWL